MTASGTLRRVASDAARFADDWPREGGRLVEQAITKRLRADTGDGGFSRARKLGRATVTVRPGRGAADVTASGSMGVWAMLQRGTKAHDVVAKGKGRAGVLRTPHGPRRRVHVSGMAAKKTWTQGADTGLAEATRDARQRLARLVP